MAHFAELGENNRILRVIVVSNSDCLDESGNESEVVGAEFCRRLFGGTWKQTSYNGRIRKNYAGIDYTYDSDLDAFIPPRPFSSWTLNDDAQWQAPVPYPTDGKAYSWDDGQQQWVIIPE